MGDDGKGRGEGGRGDAGKQASKRISWADAQTGKTPEIGAPGPYRGRFAICMRPYRMALGAHSQSRSS